MSSFRAFLVASVVLLSTVNVAMAIDLRYNGSVWFTGTASGYGTVEVYVPSGSVDSWGTDSAGNLVNVSSSTITGVMYSSNGNQYNFSAPSLAVPRVRLAGTNNSYVDIGLRVTDTNAVIGTDSMSFSRSYPYIIIGLFGVVIVCLSRFRR